LALGLASNLNETDYVLLKKSYKEKFEVEVEVKLKFDDDRLKTRLYLGSVHLINGEYFKLTEYTDIQLESTDLKVSFVAKRIHPLDRKEAKAKLLQTRKQKLQLEVY
jgi:hypothetical protein